MHVHASIGTLTAVLSYVLLILSGIGIGTLAWWAGLPVWLVVLVAVAGVWALERLSIWLFDRVWDY
jgi:hypothetical protein